MPNNSFVFLSGAGCTEPAERDDRIRQLAAALAKGSEMNSRTKHPKLWKLRDRLSKRFPAAKRDKSDHYLPMAENLADVRRTRREAEEIVFDSRGMTAAHDDPVPYRAFRIFVKTEALYLFGWDDRLTFLEKSDLREGDPADFEAYFTKRTSLECFKV